MATNIYRTSNSVDRSRDNATTVTASTTLSSGESGTTFNIATDALVVTLPPVGNQGIGASADAAPAGTWYRFRNTGADGNNIITISPAAADAIFGTVPNAAADSVSGGVDNKDIINTKATSNKGDYIILESDGSTGWYITGGVGIWASEA